MLATSDTATLNTAALNNHLARKLDKQNAILHLLDLLPPLRPRLLDVNLGGNAPAHESIIVAFSVLVNYVKNRRCASAQNRSDPVDKQVGAVDVHVLPPAVREDVPRRR